MGFKHFYRSIKCVGKSTTQWTNSSEHCRYVTVMFEALFDEVLTSFWEGISESDGWIQICDTEFN